MGYMNRFVIFNEAGIGEGAGDDVSEGEGDTEAGGVGVGCCGETLLW
jgi:hypothetical protein